ncbi:MAG: alpha/beta hydrolase [Rhodospirillales bacterium]|nr:alpha/beta hydrolase [Rhodospirillales bacterium]
MNFGTRSDATAADGIRLAVYEWGRPDGMELLLIHGFAQCHLCFAPQVASLLAEHCRIIAFDFRGHGASACPAQAAAYQGSRVWADDIASVIAATGLRRPVIAGWSMGGRITRQYLMVHGDTKLAGVNFVGSMVIEEARLRGTASVRALPADSPLGAEIATRIAFLAGCFAKPLPEAEFRIALAYNMLVSGETRRAIGGWATDPQATRDALARVRVPVLISHGTADAIVLPEAARLTQAAIPHARLSWYEGCGHSPFAEDAPRFNTELLDFVRRCQRPE